MKRLTYSFLARVTGASRENVKIWLRDAGLTLESSEAACVAAITVHQRKPPAGPAIDPATGLTWSQAKARQEAIKLERENKEAERSTSGDWVTAEHHLAILKGLCGKFDQLPGRIKSQLGLTAEQEKTIRQDCDDIRREFVEQNLTAPET